MEPNSNDDQTQNEDSTTIATTTTIHNHQQQPPFATITLSLPSLYLSPPSPNRSTSSSHTSLSPYVTNLKIPSQISSLALTTSIPPLKPRNPSPSFISNSTVTPLHDHEPLTAASDDSLSLLPVFLFDPRDFGKSSSSGFDRTGPYRAQFLIQSVSDLRSSLRSRGSDLVVRIGKPETVLVELAKAVGADTVYAHREVSNDEVRAEERVEKVMEEEGIEVKYFWGSTLYHIEDLPFELEKMPTNYGGFREKLKGVDVRKTIEALDQISGLPAQGDVEVGEVPTLMDLGLKPPPPMGQVLCFAFDY